MKSKILTLMLAFTMLFTLMPGITLAKGVQANEKSIGTTTLKEGKKTITFTAKDFGFKKAPKESINNYRSMERNSLPFGTMTKGKISYRSMGYSFPDNYLYQDRSASPNSPKPKKNLGFDPTADKWKFPIKVKFKSGIAGEASTPIDFNDPNYKLKPVTFTVVQKDGQGNIVNTFVSDPLTGPGSDPNGVSLKYASGDKQGQVADKVRAYDDNGDYYHYVISADSDAIHEVVFELRQGKVDSANYQDAIVIEYSVYRLANSHIKYVFKSKDDTTNSNQGSAALKALSNEEYNKLYVNSYDKANLKAGQQVVSTLFDEGNNKNSTLTIDLAKDGVVFRSGFGGADGPNLASTEDLADFADELFEIKRSNTPNVTTWADDGYIVLKDTQDKDVVFKVTTSYTALYGGVVTFKEQNKVIIPDDPGTGGTPTPCPSTHYEVNFKAVENGTLKTGMKTRFFVQKGLTWKEAKEAEPKLTVPVPVPINDFKLDDWYKVVNGKVDKTKTATKGLPKDETKVETATYQAEFIGKNKVVDVTPTDPNVTPELPKKPNPDFDPNKKEDPNSNPKTIPDDDYELITFKAGDNGFLSADKIKIKVYAVLKTSTWAEAEKATPKMDVPSADSTTLKLTGADNYTFTKWTKEDKETEVKFSEYGSKKISELTDKTFIAKFEANEIERENKETPIPDGYIRLEFSPGNDGKIADNNTAKTIIDVLEKANKKVGDYTKPTITPKVGYSQKKDTEAWDKADSLVINSTNADKTSAKKNELTVTAQYDKKKSIIDITPKPPTPPTPGPTPDPNPPYIPGTTTPDPDYIVVAFKAGDHGKITGGNKFYAILKDMTWQEAENNSVTGEPKLEVPSEFEPEQDYGFINWNPVIPVDKTKKLEDLVKTGESKLTYTAKFVKIIDKVEPNEPEVDGYVYVTFDAYNGKAGTDKKTGTFNKPATGELQVKYKILVGVDGVAGSKSFSKTYGDLERYNDPQITPPKDHLFKKWDKEGSAVIAKEGTSNKITVHAQYKEITDSLVVPNISQDITPNVDDENAKQVVKINFTNSPTEGSTAKLVKVSDDGTTTEITGVTINMTQGEQTVDIDKNQLKDGDKVKVIVSKTNRSDADSNIVTLDLEGPKFSDFKIVENDRHIVTVTGKVTDPSKTGVTGYNPAGVHKVFFGKDEVPVNSDGSFKFILEKKDDQEYTFTAIDKLGNKSQDKTKKSDLKDEDKFDISKKKFVEVRQAYEGQKKVMAYGQPNDVVQLFRVKTGGEIEDIAKETIGTDGRCKIEFSTPLVKWEVIYATILVNGNKDFRISEPIGMIVWSRDSSETPPTTVIPSVPSSSTQP